MSEEVKELCTKHSIDYSQMVNWYDGYLIEDYHIFNPRSVVLAIHFNNFESYWTQTETYEALKRYIDLNFDGLKDAIVQMLSGFRYKINTKRFKNDMITFYSRDDVLTLLIHLGYLTFDCNTSEAFIPNEEVRAEFVTAMKD